MTKRVPNVAILAALNECGGVVADAARMVDLSRKTFYKRLHRLGVDLRSVREGYVTVSPRGDRVTPTNLSVAVEVQGPAPTFSTNMSAALRIPAAVVPKPWTPKVKPDIKRLFTDAVERLRLKGHHTDEDNLMDAFVRQCFSGYLDELLHTLSIDRVLGPKEEK